jgi:hypothetical protein
MPTFDIDTPALPASKRRAVAVRLTRWLRDRGVDPAHVVVRFSDAGRNATFSGGMPLEALPAGDGLAHASVVCRLSPDRDELFREQLAAEVADALGADHRTPFFYLEIRPTSQSQVYLWHGGKPVRADRLGDPGR